MHMEVLQNYYVRPFCKCLFIIFYSTLNGSRYTVVHSQSNIKWCLEGSLCIVQNNWHIHKICCLSQLVTISQHFQHYQANVWSNPTNTRTAPKITNNELVNNRCRIGTDYIIAVMRMKNLPNQKSLFLSERRSSVDTGTFLFKMWQSWEKREVWEHSIYLHPTQDY